MVKNEVKIEEVLQEDISIKSTLFEKDRTATSFFLLPMLGYFVYNMPRSFVNAYIGDFGYEYYTELDQPIFLLFKVNLEYKHRNETFRRFEENMLSNPYCVDYYYVGMDGPDDLIMYVFETPAPLVNSYTAFFQSSYSTFQEEYKTMFPKNITGSSGNLIMYDVYGALYKEDFLRIKASKLIGVDIPEDQEYWDSIKLDREIFRYKHNGGF